MMRHQTLPSEPQALRHLANEIEYLENLNAMKLRGQPVSAQIFIEVYDRIAEARAQLKTVQEAA